MRPPHRVILLTDIREFAVFKDEKIMFGTQFLKLGDDERLKILEYVDVGLID